MCASLDDTSSRDIYLVDVDTGALTPFQSTRYHETGPVFSPNGRFLAYTTAFSATESTLREVFVADVPEGSMKRQVSNGGASAPQWSPDGRTLYYRAGGSILAVEMDPDAGVPVSAPRPVWRGVFGQTDPDLTDYAVAPDGRILLVEPSERGHAVEHLDVVLNWHNLLPAGR